MADWEKRYGQAKDYIRNKFRDDPRLVESDTRLFLEIVKEVSDKDLDISEDDVPAIGTVTRSSRQLRNDEGFEKLASDEVSRGRKRREESMKEVIYP